MKTRGDPGAFGMLGQRMQMKPSTGSGLPGAGDSDTLMLKCGGVAEGVELWGDSSGHRRWLTDED